MELQPELWNSILGFVAPNEIACNVRLVSKAFDDLVRSRGNTAIRLSQPVPPHAFAERWGQPGAVRDLSFQKRLHLLALTAASGVLANLEVAVVAAGCSQEARWSIVSTVIYSAAARGHYHVLQWLWQRGWPWGRVLEAAAQAGRQEMCQWLLQQRCRWCEHAVYSAARGGHLGLMEWLMQHPAAGGVSTSDLLKGAATGCDLPAFQQLYFSRLGGQHRQGQQQQQEHQQQQGGVQLSMCDKQRIVTAAAASSTADWQAKVEWLEEQGYPRSEDAFRKAARCPDAVERLVWLQQRGYEMSGWTLVAAAAHCGNLAAVEYLLASLEGLNVEAVSRVAGYAAGEGHLEIVEALHAFGTSIAQPGADGAVRLPVDLMAKAARSGNLELLQWVHARGYPMDARLLIEAAGGGNEAALGWLLEQGCPMPADGAPYGSAAEQGDLTILRCLRRLGCPMEGGQSVYEAAAAEGDLVTLQVLRSELLYPWSPTEGTFKDWIIDSFPLESLQWLVEEAGCPVDWGHIDDFIDLASEDLLLGWLKELKPGSTS